jgi:hypothetical protein
MRATAGEREENLKKFVSDDRGCLVTNKKSVNLPLSARRDFAQVASKELHAFFASCIIAGREGWRCSIGGEGWRCCCNGDKRQYTDDVSSISSLGHIEEESTWPSLNPVSCLNHICDAIRIHGFSHPKVRIVNRLFLLWRNKFAIGVYISAALS